MEKSVTCVHCGFETLIQEDDLSQAMEREGKLRDEIKRLGRIISLCEGANSRSTTVLNLIRQLLELTKDE